MSIRKQLDQHEREISEQLGFIFAMNGYTNGGSIADGTLFWAESSTQDTTVRVCRLSHGLLKNRRSYTVMINGEDPVTHEDFALSANLIVKKVIDEKSAAQR